eukprot:401894_1
MTIFHFIILCFAVASSSKVTILPAKLIMTWNKGSKVSDAKEITASRGDSNTAIQLKDTGKGDAAFKSYVYAGIDSGKARLTLKGEAKFRDYTDKELEALIDLKHIKNTDGSIIGGTAAHKSYYNRYKAKKINSDYMDYYGYDDDNLYDQFWWEIDNDYKEGYMDGYKKALRQRQRQKQSVGNGKRLIRHHHY